MDDYRKASITPKMMNLLSFAEKVTRDASQVTRDDIERLRSAGFSDRAVLDAAHIAGFFSYMNRVVQALGADTMPAAAEAVKNETASIFAAHDAIGAQ
jgi:uncharacterized peroxidase-related enzyme